MLEGGAREEKNVERTLASVVIGATRAMDDLKEIVANWNHGLYVAEQWRSEVFCQVVGLLERAVLPDRTLLTILDSGYSAYLAQLIYHQRADPQASVRYVTSRQRVLAALALPAGRPAAPTAAPSAAPHAAVPPSPQVGAGRKGPGETTRRDDRVATPPPSTSRGDTVAKPSRKRPAPADEDLADDGDDVGRGEPFDPEIELLATSERYLGQFKTYFRQETFSVTDLQEKLLENEVYMETLFDKLLGRQIEILNAKDYDRCVLELRGSDENRAIWFNLRPIGQLSGKVILDKLVRTLNSNESFLAGVFHLSFVYVPSVSGGGRNTIYHEGINHWIKRYCKTKSLYDPENAEDKMCLARCIAFLQLQATSKNRSKTSRMRRPGNKMMTELALKLCEKAGVDKNKVCTYDDILKFQSIIKERIVVFIDVKCEESVFCGPLTDANGVKRARTLILIQHEEHFYGVVRIKAIHGGGGYYCYECLKWYTSSLSHTCQFSCSRCDGQTLHTESPLIKCNACCRHFAGKECFETHLMKRTSKLSVCDLKKYCVKCEKGFLLDGKTKMKAHICGWKLCKYCTNYVPENHECYMMFWEPRPKTKDVRYMRCYFDIETRQDDKFESRDNWQEHKPNLLISQQVCDECEKDRNIHNDCKNCGKRENIFEGFHKDSNVVGDFLDYLISLHQEKKTHITLFAHNLKAFDGYFITQELLARSITPKVTLVGAKILNIKTDGFSWKDSIMFLPQPLASLPRAFALKELKKGYFCHLANCEKYYDYSGPMLPKELYCCSTFSVDGLATFEKWYDEQVKSDYVFNFKKEIILYTQSDVNILREAMENFRGLFMESADFDPLFNCTTLSAACMANFRKNHLGDSKLGIVPRGGYRGRDMASYEALQWLSYQESVLGHKITHAENSREVVVLGHPVDGYVEIPMPDGSIQKTILSYYGCYFHLCLRCIPDVESRRKICGRRNGDPYVKTKKMVEKHRAAGYVVIEKWACEFHDDMENNADVIEFFEKNPFTRVKPLNLRDAICGGRTSALYSEYTADLKRGEQIKFFDVISEYPSVQHHKMYPEGHPKIYCEGDPSMPPLDSMNGVIMATVLPPRDLFLPVLPLKCCKKLMFPLCRLCAETMNQNECNHNDKERELFGTWCAPEVQLAVRKGYKISTVHECYQYPRVRMFNPQTKEDGLFSSYVRENMAMKIEATGWPSHVVTDEDKENFIQKHLKKDGIILNKANFEKNPGKRTLAKLILNSFWGKLGEKTLRPRTEFVKSYSELVRLTEDSTISISSIIPFGDDLLQVSYTPVQDMEDSLKTTSLVHAAFTTAHGRIMLYEYLSIVDDRALYHDTDSICFISRDGLPEPPLGEYLGCLSDQLSDDYGVGSFCTEFVSAGAKNYAYRVAVAGDLSNIKTVVKVRGISINSSCSETVTFDRLKSMVRGEYKKTIVNIPAQIARVSKWRIVTRPSSKTWRVCLNKRRRLENKTVPFGFKGQMLDADDYDCMMAMINMDENL